jgi:hypothetical protein
MRIERKMTDRWVRVRQITGLLLGFLGIFILDLAFIGSSYSDLLYLPQALQGIAAPSPSAPQIPQVLGLSLLGNGNIYLYLIGTICLAIAMVDLYLGNRVTKQRTH